MADTVKLRVIMSTVGETISGTYQCRMTLTFETEDRIAAEGVLKRFHGMEMTLENTLHDEIFDLQRATIKRLQDETEEVARRHKAEIETLQQTISLQAKELQRLKDLEEQLRDISQFAVNPSGSVLR